MTFTDASNGNGATIVDWDWVLTSGPIVINASGPVFITEELLPGIYQVCLTVTTADGCTDTECTTYAVAPQEIFIPNVFSPNNDGYNDVLEFTNLEFYPNSDLIVYSRWGNVVYESASYRNTWNGRDASDGTYFYVLHVSDGRTFTGHVTLLR